MATSKSINASAFHKINSGATNLNKRVEMDELMAILVERQRAASCLRSKGVPDDQAARCGCTFCSPEAQREKFGATIKEMDAQFAEEAALTTARRKTRYVRGVTDRHNRATSDRHIGASLNRL